MTKRTKELFEALTLLRYAAEHNTNDIYPEEVQDAYYKIFDILSAIKYVEDQNEQLQAYEKQQQDKYNEIHEAVMLNFNNKGAIEIAKDITDRMVKLNIANNYVISEMSDGKIGIIDSKSDPKNKTVLRYYDDIYDYEINVEDDLKCNFQRQKLFENMRKLSPNKEENIE